MTDLNAILAALADPVRRSIVERLLNDGDKTVGEIAAPFAISAPAVSRHLQILERARLIEQRVHRQWRLVRVRPEALGEVESWISLQRRHWMEALNRPDAVISEATPRGGKSQTFFP
jgi:DNA-binding transcriptional ArsR family regulator